MGQRKDSIPDEIVTEAMRRYSDGGSLFTIASDLDVDYRQLSMATAVMRKDTRRQRPKLLPEVIDAAAARWQQGETLAAIARDLGVNYDLLAASTASHRKKVKRRPRRAPFAEGTIHAAMLRYRQGESLHAIAHDMGLDYQHLVRMTAAHRKSMPPKPPVLALNEQQMKAVLARWEGGDTLTAIARDLGVSPRHLARATAAHRQDAKRSPCQRPRLSALPLSAIEAAARRWQQGETLGKIARSMGVPYQQLARMTAPHREGLKQQTLLTPEALDAAIALWRQGMKLKDIADRLNVAYSVLTKATAPMRGGKRSQRRPPLSETIINAAVERWQQGEALTAIASDMGVPLAQLYQQTIDARQKARRLRRSGTSGGASQLTPDIIAAVRGRRANGESLTDIAKELGIPFQELYEQVRLPLRRK